MEQNPSNSHGILKIITFIQFKKAHSQFSYLIMLLIIRNSRIELKTSDLRKYMSIITVKPFGVIHK